MKKFYIGKNDAGQRLDKFLAKALPALGRGAMFKAIRKRNIRINGKRCEPKYRLCEGDSVELYLADFLLEKDNSLSELFFLEVSSDISVVYEDDNILIVDKPLGLVVHEDESGSKDTLIARIWHYLYEKGEYSPTDEESFAPALCNRIDRNTRGLVICAKNAPALRVLNSVIKHRHIDKRYYAMCFGKPKKTHDVLTAYLRRDEKNKQVEIYPQAVAGAQKIVTEYWLRESNEKFSLLELALHTGRTHQIRAHMAYIGCPLVGDTKYGLARNNKNLPFRFQALCAYSVTFLETDYLEHLSYLSGKTISLDEIGFSLKDLDLG